MECCEWVHVIRCCGYSWSRILLPRFHSRCKEHDLAEYCNVVPPTSLQAFEYSPADPLTNGVLPLRTRSTGFRLVIDVWTTWGYCWTFCIHWWEIPADWIARFAKTVDYLRMLNYHADQLCINEMMGLITLVGRTFVAPWPNLHRSRIAPAGIPKIAAFPAGAFKSAKTWVVVWFSSKRFLNSTQFFLIIKRLITILTIEKIHWEIDCKAMQFWSYSFRFGNHWATKCGFEKRDLTNQIWGKASCWKKQAPMKPVGNDPIKCIRLHSPAIRWNY